MKAANVPPFMVIIQRINLGLYAIFGELHATGNWRRIAEELWPFVDGPPSTPMGEAIEALAAANAIPGCPTRGAVRPRGAGVVSAGPRAMRGVLLRPPGDVVGCRPMLTSSHRGDRPRRRGAGRVDPPGPHWRRPRMRRISSSAARVVAVLFVCAVVGVVSSAVAGAGRTPRRRPRCRRRRSRSRAASSTPTPTARP